MPEQELPESRGRTDRRWTVPAVLEWQEREQLREFARREPAAPEWVALAPVPSGLAGPSDRTLA